MYFICGNLLVDNNRLCVPRCSVCILLIEEVHYGSLAGNFGIQKTLTMLQEHYYWLKMLSDVTNSLLSVAHVTGRS